MKTLKVEGLTYLYPDTSNGVRNIHLEIHRGSLTVITGRIGSGKTTLLRSLLGLLPMQNGRILWNDVEIEAPDQFFVPPYAAYTPQVPRLFSESLKSNILLGIDPEKTDLQAAIELAVLDDDIRGLENGLETKIGPRGVKLSGGQMQRTAAARMFVREPELHVFDDLSSALDVETEHKLWSGLFKKEGATCLVVTHRKAVLKRADQIIVLKQGRVEAVGTLPALLSTCSEMQNLWKGELGPDITPSSR